MLTKTYWTDRYRSNDTPWDLGNISNPLKTYIDQITNKELSILIPGSGNGHEALYFVKNGFSNVTCLDIATEPLERLSSFSPQIKCVNKDFFEHKGNYDLILEQTFFCALNPRFRGGYFKKASELLKPKGKLVGLWFNFVEIKSEPPYGGSKKEYLALLQEFFTVKTIEECYNSEKSRERKELFLNLIKKQNGH